MEKPKKNSLTLEEQEELLRFDTVGCLLRGACPEAVSAEYGIPKSTLLEWHSAYQLGGAKALLAPYSLGSFVLN
ncbi:MAG: helix-turn-helix domain-containing protein [Candidatus Melainabacteria bacterium]